MKIATRMLSCNSIVVDIGQHQNYDSAEMIGKCLGLREYDATIYFRYGGLPQPVRQRK